MAESEMTGGLYPQPIGSAFCYNFAGPAEADAPHLLTEEAYEAAVLPFLYTEPSPSRNQPAAS